MPRGQLTHSYLEAIYERRKLAGSVLLVVMLLSGFYAFWTRQYTAASIVALTPQSAPSPDRPRGIAFDAVQTALTDVRLGAISVRLYPEMVRRGGEANAIGYLRSRISLQALGPDKYNSGEVGISYSGQDRAMVIKVANALAQSLTFVHLRAVDSLPADTTAKIERQLEDSGAELKLFAARQHAQNPKRPLEASLSKVEGLRTSFEEDRKKFTALEQQRHDQERVASSAVRAPGPAAESAAAKAIKQQIKDGEARLIELRERYTDQYPDVQDAKEEIEELRTKLKNLPAENPHPAKESLPTGDGVQIARQEEEIRADEARLKNELQRNTAKQEALPKKLSVPPNKFALAYALELDRYEALLNAEKTAKEFQGGEAPRPMFTVLQNATTAKATGPAGDTGYWLTSLLVGLFSATLFAVLADRFTGMPVEQTAVRQEQTAVRDQELAPHHGTR
jgi:hypothetical protein